jgi:membrane fusion protein, heavy metal efflux system
MNTAISTATDDLSRSSVDHDMDHEAEREERARLRMGWGQRAVVALLLMVVTVPSVAGFYSYFAGVPLHLLAAKEEGSEADGTVASPGVALVSGQPHTVEVSDEVADTLGIRKAYTDSVAVARAPRATRPLVLTGSTALDPTRLARIRARFAPARVVEIARVGESSRAGGITQFRELRQGDTVFKGDHLATFYSLDVGSKKNDLLDALVQLEFDQKVFDEAEKHVQAVANVFMITALRAVRSDRNAINRAINNLRLWEIPREEIEALHTQAKTISSDKNAWFKTPEGKWVKKAIQPNAAKANVAKKTKAAEDEETWGRVTLRVPFDGVVVERNLHVDEMVVDNTIDLFQIADVSRLLVIASCPEDLLPTLEALGDNHRRWTVQSVGAEPAMGLPGTIDEIGYLIDPNQHTAIIKGYVDNPERHLRAGQYITATVQAPPPDDVVEIAIDAVVDDGRQSLVFVQPDADKHRFIMRRVHVTHRFDHTVFVRSSAIPKEEQLTAPEAEEGLLPKQPVRPGERILLAGSIALKRVVLELESRPLAHPDGRLEGEGEVDLGHRVATITQAEGGLRIKLD